MVAGLPRRGGRRPRCDRDHLAARGAARADAGLRPPDVDGGLVRPRRRRRRHHRLARHPPMLDNLDRANLAVTTIDGHRRRGYATAMLAHVEQVAQAPWQVGARRRGLLAVRRGAGRYGCQRPGVRPRPRLRARAGRHPAAPDPSCRRRPARRARGRGGQPPCGVHAAVVGRARARGAGRGGRRDRRRGDDRGTDGRARPGAGGRRRRGTARGRAAAGQAGPDQVLHRRARRRGARRGVHGPGDDHP